MRIREIKVMMCALGQLLQKKEIVGDQRNVHQEIQGHNFNDALQKGLESQGTVVEAEEGCETKTKQTKRISKLDT
ncbi:hypothetical protein SUGI_0527180 [Cryptomeria japonica]|nr:hypothetical protein SUGI_0527180 [Cryptomeria japonica]